MNGYNDFTAPSHSRSDRRGAYGCSASGGRVVRLVWIAAPGAKPPRALHVDCPVCGARHLVKPMWRAPTERDVGIEPELHVIAVPPGPSGTPVPPTVAPAKAAAA